MTPTPKEKAEELFNKIYNISGLTKESKQIALIAVDEILKLENNNGYYFDGTNVTSISYWLEVKQELKKSQQ
jgi:hypothetical protein